MSNCLDLDQDQRFVSTDLGPNCLQRLSTDYKCCKYCSEGMVNTRKRFGNFREISFSRIALKTY